MDIAITTCYLRAAQRREEIDMFFALLFTPPYNWFREEVRNHAEYLPFQGFIKAPAKAASGIHSFSFQQTRLI